MFFKDVNKMIKNQIVSKEDPATYSKLVAVVHKISNDLAALNVNNEGWRSFNNRNNNSESSNNNFKPQSNNNIMKWKLTTLTAAACISNKQSQGKTCVKWVSKKVINSWCDKGQCLHCESDAHFINQCDKEPARRSEFTLESLKKWVWAAATKAMTFTLTVEEVKESDTTLNKSKNK